MKPFPCVAIVLFTPDTFRDPQYEGLILFLVTTVVTLVLLVLETWKLFNWDTYRDYQTRV